MTLPYALRHTPHMLNGPAVDAFDAPALQPGNCEACCADHAPAALPGVLQPPERQQESRGNRPTHALSFASPIENEDFSELPACCGAAGALDLDEPMGSLKALLSFSGGAALRWGTQLLTGWCGIIAGIFGKSNYVNAEVVLEKIGKARSKNITDLERLASSGDAAACSAALGERRRSRRRAEAVAAKLQFGERWQHFVRVFEGVLPVVCSLLTLGGLWIPFMDVMGMSGIVVSGLAHLVRYVWHDMPRCDGQLTFKKPRPLPPYAKQGQQLYERLQASRRQAYAITAAGFGGYAVGAGLYVAGTLGGQALLKQLAALPLLGGMALVTVYNNLVLPGTFINNQRRFVDPNRLGNKDSMLRQLMAGQVEKEALQWLRQEVGYRPSAWERLVDAMLVAGNYLFTVGRASPILADRTHRRRLQAYQAVDRTAVLEALRQVGEGLGKIWQEETEALSARLQQDVDDGYRAAAMAYFDGIQLPHHSFRTSTYPAARTMARFWKQVGDPSAATAPCAHQGSHLVEQFKRLWVPLTLLDIDREYILPAWGSRVLAAVEASPWWTFAKDSATGKDTAAFDRKRFVEELREENPVAQQELNGLFAEVTHHLLHVEVSRLDGMRASLLDLLALGRRGVAGRAVAAA